MTKLQNILRGVLFGLVIAGLYLVSGQLNITRAQQGDPFAKPVLSKKYLRANKPAEPVLVTPPTIEERITGYRTAKINAMRAGTPAPKPTTILLLSEVEVTGIFHTPRGYAAMVEATPLTTSGSGQGTGSKLSYVVYPGEAFYDGQLVAIEEGRLTFRKFVTWTSGRKDKVAEVKNLRLPNAVTDGLQAARTTEGAPAAKPEESSHAADPSRQQ
jgi:hypothetical protein